MLKKSLSFKVLLMKKISGKYKHFRCGANLWCRFCTTKSVVQNFIKLSNTNGSRLMHVSVHKMKVKARPMWMKKFCRFCSVKRCVSVKERLVKLKEEAARNARCSPKELVEPGTELVPILELIFWVNNHLCQCQEFFWNSSEYP